MLALLGGVFVAGVFLGSDQGPTVADFDEILATADAFTVHIVERHGDEEFGVGSGVVVSAADGLVLTNFHVVAGATALRATLVGGEANLRIRARAPCEDLALLELDPKPAGLVEAVLQPEVYKGEDVFTLGFPDTGQESEATYTQGTVSASPFSSEPSSSLPRFAALIQTDAAINPGNSGGPLVNMAGQVVGINTWGDDEEQNQNYAIGAGRVLELLPQLIAGRSLAYVGWELLPTEYDAEELEESIGRKVPEGKGLVVEQLDLGFPAARAGFKIGDLVQTIVGTEVSSVQGVCQLLASAPGGTRLSVQGISIDGKRFSREITL